MTVPKRYRIAPSLLSADFGRLRDEVQAIEAAGADLLHLDVMDNHYVPNLTIGPMVLGAIRPHTRLPIDVHLMVEPVDALAGAFADAGADIISFHPEASRHPDRTLQVIRDHGCRCGLVLNPATPLTWLDHTVDSIDLLLLMSVNPGFGGQQFIDYVLHKIGAARQRLDAVRRRSGREIWLEVDGGIKVDNIAAVAAAGGDTFVAGSAVFGAPDPDGGYGGVIGRMREALDAVASEGSGRGQPVVAAVGTGVSATSVRPDPGSHGE
jgi:ribulose-phosphate 3-epimerase